MANKDELKEKFSKGKTPSEQDFSDLIDGVEGPQGDPGNNGKDLKFSDLTSKQKEELKGKQGDPGENGFGTEEQYNDIIERLEALEEQLESDVVEGE